MNNRYNILIVEDDQFSIENLKFTLSRDYNLYTAVTVNQAEEIINTSSVDVVILDIKLPGENGLTLIERTREKYPEVKYIVITGYSDEDSIITALRLGAHDLLKKPYDEEEFLNSLKNCLKSIELERENQLMKQKLQRENIILKKDLDKNFELKEKKIIGKSPALVNILDKAKSVARHDINTLICGESGTGKELLARYIHKIGPRKDKPFIAVNCASLTPSLFESELFGYEKGAFTNAVNSRIGLLEIADGGILFLDEITEIESNLQAKLLRAVEDKKVQRIGGNNLKSVDVQILSSTNRDLSKVIAEGKIREDLFHRLTGVTLELPPLRQRRDDMPLLLEYFKDKYDSLYAVNSKEFDSETISAIQTSDWSGNIRQLSNFVKNWCLFSHSASPDEIKNWIRTDTNNKVLPEECFYFEEGTMLELEEAKKWLIKRALLKFDGNKTKAAEHLGISYAGLFNMMKNLGID